MVRARALTRLLERRPFHTNSMYLYRALGSCRLDKSSDSRVSTQLPVGTSPRFSFVLENVFSSPRGVRFDTLSTIPHRLWGKLTSSHLSTGGWGATFGFGFVNEENKVSFLRGEREAGAGDCAERNGEGFDHPDLEVLFDEAPDLRAQCLRGTLRCCVMPSGTVFSKRTLAKLAGCIPNNSSKLVTCLSIETVDPICVLAIQLIRHYSLGLTESRVSSPHRT